MYKIYIYMRCIYIYMRQNLKDGSTDATLGVDWGLRSKQKQSIESAMNLLLRAAGSTFLLGFVMILRLQNVVVDRASTGAWLSVCRKRLDTPLPKAPGLVLL